MSKPRTWLAVSIAAFGLVASGCDASKTAKADDPKAEASDEANKDEAKKDESKSATGASKNPQPQSNPSSMVAAPKVPFTATGPVAKVNGKEISAETFNKEVTAMMRMMPMLPPNQIASMKPRVLDNVINKVLIEDATKGEIANVSDADLKAEYARFEENANKQPGGVKAVFDRMGLTEATLKEEMKKSLAMKQTLEKQKVKTTVSKDEIKKFYDENKTRRYEKPKQVKASHILFKLDKDAKPEAIAEAKKKAEAMVKEAKAPGADFAELAKKHSEGPSGPRGGDLGFFAKERMVPPFSEAAFSMKKNEISAPVKTQFGYHVIKVTDIQEPTTVKLSEVEGDIKLQLEGQMMRAAMKTFIDDLNKNAKIERMEANIKDNPEFAKGAPSTPALNLQNLNMPNKKLKLTPPSPGTTKKPGAPK